MSRAGGRQAGAKRAEVQQLVQQAADKHAAAQRVEEMPDEIRAKIDLEMRVVQVLDRCRAKVINEPALWFRSGEWEGTRIAEVYLQEAYTAMLESMGNQVVVPS